MRLPKQSPPIVRPDLIQAHETVDVVNGSVDELVAMRIRLLHGANYNAPAAFQYRTYNQLKGSCSCGCMR